MSAPTRPGWYRVLVTYADGQPFQHGLAVAPRGDDLEVWEVVIVRWRQGAGVADFAWTLAMPVGTVHPARWGSRVEFPGDEPDLWRRAALDASSEVSRLRAVIDDMRGRAAAAIVAKGPLTPDSEGWWWHRFGEPDKPEGMCDWQPRLVVTRQSGADKGLLVFDYGHVKDDGRWGGRAVPPVTPAVEASAPELEPPPGWTIEEHGLGWMCAEQVKRFGPAREYFSRPTRAAAIAAAWECVRKREAEGEPDNGFSLSTLNELRAEAWAVIVAGEARDPARALEIAAVKLIETRIVDRRDEP